VSRGVRWLLLAGLLMAWVVTLAAQAAGDETPFARGNRLYQQGRFREAAKAYEQRLDQAPGDWAALYNLGNAYFRLGDVGRAVLAYERASRLRPRDRDLRANLELARLFVAASPELGERSGLHRAVAALQAGVTLREVLLGLSAALWLFCAAWSWRLAVLTGHLRRVAKWGMALAGAAAILLAPLAAAKVYDAAFVHQAIVVAPDVQALSGPGPNFEPAFSLAAGMQVQVTGERGLWREVQPSPGTHGWVRADQVELIQQRHPRSAGG